MTKSNYVLRLLKIHQSARLLIIKNLWIYCPDNDIIQLAILYLTVLPYVTLLGMIVQIVSEKWLPINQLFVYALCFALALLVSKTSFFKKLYAIIPALVIVLVLSIYRKMIPISLDWKGYLLVFVTLIVQMIVSRITYQSINQHGKGVKRHGAIDSFFRVDAIF